jgi:hypothetical protein
MTMTSLAFVAGLLFATTSTQPDVDARWQPWLGCWQMLDESVIDGSAALAELLGTPAPKSNPAAGALVCVTPAGAAGATFTTLVNDRSVLTETIVADGSEKSLTEPDCRGWQRAEWSKLGARLFARAEITCTGQPPRKVSEMALMIAGPTWIDVQLIDTEGRKNLRVRRYRRAADQRHAGTLPVAPRGTAVPLSTRLSTADVKEAVTKVEPETLQAALVELGRGFDLNGKELIELDKAGVPDNVTDLMVALSFPQRFVIERSTRSSGYSSGWSSGFDEMWPYFTHPYFYTSYYAPFGYRYWGHYDSYYFGGPGFVTVEPDRPGTAQPSGDGRVVDGLGYTRVRRNQPAPSSPGRMRDGGDGTSTASTARGGSSSSGSSSGGSSGVSSSGYSGGGGGGDRTAVSRPPEQR